MDLMLNGTPLKVVQNDDGSCSLSTISKNNHTFQSGATATGNGTSYVNSDNAPDLMLAFEFAGTSFEAVVEGRVKGLTFRTIAAVKSTDFTIVASVTSAAALYSVSIKNVSEVRVRISAITDGVLSCYGIVG